MNIYKTNVKPENLAKAQEELQIIGAQYKIEQVGENYLLTIFLDEKQEKMVAQRATKKCSDFWENITNKACSAGKLSLKLGFGLARITTIATVVGTATVANVAVEEANKTIESLRTSKEVAEATSNLKKLFFRRKS